MRTESAALLWDVRAAAERIAALTRIIAMRNILAHAYAVADDGVVWEAATARVPELVEVVEELLADTRQ